LWQLRFGVDPQGVGVSRDGLLDLLGWIGGEGGKSAVGSAEIVICGCPGLWQLRFGVDPQGVGVSRDGLLDLLGWIGGEGGKSAVGIAEIVICIRSELGMRQWPNASPFTLLREQRCSADFLLASGIGKQ